MLIYISKLSFFDYLCIDMTKNTYRANVLSILRHVAHEKYHFTRYLLYHVRFIVKHWIYIVMKYFFRLFATLLLTIYSLTVYAEGDNALPQVKLETTHGDIVIELNLEKAPNTVANFLSYVEDGYYDGTVFHRVIDTFMIQGGGFTADLAKKPTNAAIKNEANNGLSNVAGSVAMARTGDPHSATAQFFINTVDNNFLDFRGEEGAAWGYAVFGQVVEGQDVIEAIRAVETGARGPFPTDVPLEDVVINKASIVE